MLAISINLYTHAENPTKIASVFSPIPTITLVNSGI